MPRNEEFQGHGRKRPAQADPDGAQPLTKKLSHLRLDNNVPISARAKPKGHIQPTQPIQSTQSIQPTQLVQSTQPIQSTHPVHSTQPFQSTEPIQPIQPTQPTRSTQPIQSIHHNQPNHTEHSSSAPGLDDAMWLDDTKHTTYIHNLEQELMEADSPSGLVFSPFAAKVLSVPQSVLSDLQPSGKELVLYTEPSSLTVPKEKDHVRKAILESRARARAESNKSIESDITLPNLEDSSSYDDPMDID